MCISLWGFSMASLWWTLVGVQFERRWARVFAVVVNQVSFVDVMIIYA